MKLLAFSDIHNNLVCVRKLRSLETNMFDAIIVAGDIGNEAAPAFFKILSTFECPVVYVLGNWDHKLDYKSCFGSRCHALHLSCVTIGPLTFTGFSGLTTEQNQKTLIKILRRSVIDFSRTILITHERLWRIGRDMPGLSLHVYGHIHRFREHDFKGTKYVNVAALDRPVTARPRHKSRWSDHDCRNFNAGNYTIIALNSSSEIAVKCLYLPHDYPNWLPLERRQLHGIQWVPEEKRWTNPSDPRLIRYETIRF